MKSKIELLEKQLIELAWTITVYDHVLYVDDDFRRRAGINLAQQIITHERDKQTQTGEGK